MRGLEQEQQIKQPYDVERFDRTGELVFTGSPLPPAPYERGFKDVVRANPGEVTRIIARFGDYFGPYVWHCHILEHEELDTPPSSSGCSYCSFSKK